MKFFGIHSFSLPVGILLSFIVHDVALCQVLPSEPTGVTSEATGVMFTTVSGSGARGSAVVARNQRLLYSCAHLVYEQGEWATEYSFFRAYDAENAPNEEDGIPARGFVVFAGYAPAVESTADNSPQAFALDFAIFYAPGENFGIPIEALTDGVSPLRSGFSKRIVGYPAELAHNGASGKYFQHTTQSFSLSARQRFDAYYWFDDVTTGPGNSGGPVLVTVDGEEKLAAILISGNPTGSGVRALDPAADKVASRALRRSTGPALNLLTKKFENTNSLKIPDFRSRFSRRVIPVRGFTSEVEKIEIDVKIQTKRRGDLDVYVRSPGGRIQWVHRNHNRAGKNLRVKQKDASATFRGESANGKWNIYMRDVFPGDAAKYESGAITITADAIP